MKGVEGLDKGLPIRILAILLAGVPKAGVSVEYELAIFHASSPVASEPAGGRGSLDAYEKAIHKAPRPLLYFCILEALQNVQKYPQASSAAVRVREGGQGSACRRGRR
jgi:hypothetical protein